MDRDERFQDPAPEREDSPTTRSEALRESLKARRPPEPQREFSTLVVRSESPQTAHEESSATDVEHPVDCTCRDAAVWPPEAAAALVREFGRSRGDQLGPECAPDCPVVVDAQAEHSRSCPAWTAVPWNLHGTDW